MTRDAAVGIIQNRLGQRTNSEVTTQIIGELQLAQSDLELEPSLPWFMIKSVTENESTASFSTETDFIRELQEVSGLSVVISGQRLPLVKDDFDYLSRQESLTGTGQPKFYSLLGSTYYLFPVPNGVYSFTKIYYATQALLTSNIENSWLKHIPGLLISIAGERMARYLRDPEATGLFVQDIQVYRKQLLDADIAHRTAALEAFVGG